MARRPKTIAQFRAYQRGLPRYIDHEELLYMMHELSRLISVHFDRAMTRHQLTHSQWWALMHIYEHEGATQTELADIMQLGRASAGNVIERLEAKNWVERRLDLGDNRVRRVYLRDEVVEMFMVMNEEGQGLFKALLKGVTPDKEQETLKVLHLIRANAGGEAPPSVGPAERSGRRGRRT